MYGTHQKGYLRCSVKTQCLPLAQKRRHVVLSVYNSVPESEGS